jgi:hypothetical protein
VGKLTVQHYRRARELSWENLEVHRFNSRGGVCSHHTSMMVTRIEAVYATFSDAQTLARYFPDTMNAKTLSSSMGWIPPTRKYSSTFKSFLDTTRYYLAGRPVPPSQQLGGPRGVTSSTATFRPIGGMINQPIQSDRDEAQHQQVVQGAMGGMQTPRMEWQFSRPREIQEDSHELFPSPWITQVIRHTQNGYIRFRDR